MSTLAYLFICNDPQVASYVLGCGVDRIFVDLELLGKDQRQGHLSTVISRHTMADVARMGSVVPRDRLMVRVNPLYSGTAEEIDQAIDLGAGIIMLPMFQSVEDVRQVAFMIDGRAGLIPLVETPGGVASLEETVALQGVSEIYIGLNDLHLALGLTFMFELLVDGTVERMASVIRSAGLPFGFGGIARAGEGLLPGEFILGEHARLGSTRVILSRTFHRQVQTAEELATSMNFPYELQKLSDAYEDFSRSGFDRLEANRQHVSKLVKSIREERAWQK